MSRKVDILVLLVLLLPGCKSPNVEKEAPTFVLSDEAQIQREIVTQAAAANNWPAALAAGDQLVALAPTWPEAYFIRAGVRSRAGKASDGPLVWSIREESGDSYDPGTLEIFSDGRLVATMRASDGSTSKNVASWTKVENRYTAKHQDFTYSLTVEDKAIKGSVRYGDSSYWVKGTLKNTTGASAMADAHPLLAGAAEDLAKYLVLNPKAGDRGELIASIADLRLRAPVPNAPAIPPERLLDESQIQREMATQAAAAAKWEAALAAADRAVELAPTWPEAYFTRAGVRARASEASGPPELARDTWSTTENWDGERSSGVYELHADGRFRQNVMVDEVSWESGTWTRENGKLTAKTPTLRYALVTSGDSMIGTVTNREDSDYSASIKGTIKERKEAKADARLPLATGAAADLEKYLSMQPDSSERAVVVRAIADLRLRAAALGTAPKPTP